MRRAIPILFALAACDEGGGTAEDPAADAAIPAVDAADPAMDAAGPATDAADLLPDLAVPTPDVAGPTPDSADPGSDAAVPQPDAAVEVPPEGLWAPAPPLAGGPRQETAVVALDGLIYVIGGFDGRAGVVGTVEAYDPATRTWREAAPLPVRLHHANAAAVDGRLYVLGFLTGLGFTEDPRTFVYDPATDAWSDGPPLPAGTARGAAGVAVLDGRIYLAGGFAGGRAVATFSAFEPATGEWAALPDLPGGGRDHGGAAAVGGRIAVVGGRARDIGAHTTRVDLFDPATATWAEGAPMPTSRGGFAIAALDDRLYVFGGEGNDGDPSGVFPQVEAYDATTDTWTTLAPMPTPRHGTGAAALDGRIYVPGGATRQAFGAVDTVEVFTPPP